MLPRMHPCTIEKCLLPKRKENDHYDIVEVLQCHEFQLADQPELSRRQRAIVFSAIQTELLIVDALS